MVLFVQLCLFAFFLVLLFYGSKTIKTTGQIVFHFNPSSLQQKKNGPPIGARLDLQSFFAVEQASSWLDELPKPMIVNFVHTGCAHCPRHTRELIDADPLVSRHLLLMTTESSTESVEAWLEEHKFTGVHHMKAEPSFLMKNEITRFPTTLLVDQDYVIRYKPFDTPDSVDQFRKLLAANQ